MPETTDQERKEGTIAVARSEGCMCDVEVRIEKIAPNTYIATACHDDWCPLIRAQDMN